MTEFEAFEKDCNRFCRECDVPPNASKQADVTRAEALLALRDMARAWTDRAETILNPPSPTPRPPAPRFTLE